MTLWFCGGIGRLGDNWNTLKAILPAEADYVEGCLVLLPANGQIQTFSFLNSLPFDYKLYLWMVSKHFPVNSYDEPSSILNTV